MNFGLGYLTPHPNPDYRENPDPEAVSGSYRETLERVQVAEEVGFASAWVAEHHVDVSNHFTSPLVVAGTILQATQTMTVGTGMVLAPFQNPISLAESSATLDNLAPGRFELGLGIGYHEEEFDLYSVDKSSRVDRLVDCVEVCKRSWTGEPFQYEGATVSCEDARVEPVPLAGADLPVLIGALVEPAVRRAARIADGLIVTPTADLDQIRTMVGWLEDEGIDSDFKIYVMRYAAVGEDRDDAWSKIKSSYFTLQERYAQWFAESSDEMVDVEDPEALWKSWMMMGSPDQLTRELREIERMIGEDDHVILKFFFPGRSHAETTRDIRTFGNEVITQF